MSISKNRDSGSVKVAKPSVPAKGSDDPHHFTIPSAIAFTLLGAIWGSAFLAIFYAVRAFPPFTLVMLRLAVGSIGMFVIFGVTLWRDVDARTNFHNVVLTKSTMAKLAFMGFVNNAVPFVLVAAAELYVSAGVASVLDASIPLFGQLFAHFFLKGEHITRMKAVGLLVGFLGVILVCLQGLIASDEGFCWEAFAGYIMVTVATASYGIASVFARSKLKGVDGRLASTFQILFGFLYCAIGAMIMDLGIVSKTGSAYFTMIWDADLRAWLSILYLGIFSTVVAYLLYFYLVHTIGSVRQTMVGYLLPVFGVFEGAMFNGEWNGVSAAYIAIEVVGASLICSGIAVASLKVPARWSKTAGREEDEGISLLPSSTSINMLEA